jgi:hypothetical protein
MDVIQDIHTETSIVRTEKPPTATSWIRIQKTKTSMDIRQNIHAETSCCKNREDSNRYISV